VVTSCFDIIP